MKNLLLPCIFPLVFSCQSEIPASQVAVVEKKEFLNHEILNDSINYKIKEYKKNNYVYRNICVFNKEKLLSEELIYKVQKKELLDEGYNTATKKIYEFVSKTALEVIDYTFHYFKYEIESVDTVVTQIDVSATGDIIKKNKGK